jgi:adenylate cyclase
MGPDVELAILFADVVGSTQLYEQLGDDKAREMVARCLEIMREATEDEGGTVVKTMGDEIMATFETADSAMNAARRMQEGIGSDPALAHDAGHVAIRIGCHYGSVVSERHDVFGSAVHIASRMTSQAKGGQIITTAGMVERLSSAWQGLCREIDFATVRGRADEVLLFEVLWQPEEATGMLPTVGIGASRRAKKRLKLSFQGKDLIVGEGHKTATLGRGEDNDVVINGSLISRLHARVISSKDRFTLVDSSTNGTFVKTGAGDDLYVRRDSTPLTGEGIIGLGRVPQPESELVVRYSVED